MGEGQPLEQKVSIIHLDDVIGEFIKRIEPETAKKLLIHKGHYDNLMAHYDEQNPLLAFIVAHRPTGCTFVKGIATSIADIILGKYWDVIGDGSHAIVEGWLPELEAEFGESQQAKLQASWLDGNRRRYG